MESLLPSGPPVPLAGFSGAKFLLLAMVVALPLILVIGAWLRRSRPR